MATPQTVVAEIDKLSPNTHITFVDDPVAGRKLAYTATNIVGSINVTANGLPFAGRADNAVLTLTGVPTALTLSLGSEGVDRVLLNAGAGLGSVYARLTSGPADTLVGSGIQMIDNAAQYTLAARMTGLKVIDVRQRPWIDLNLQTTTPQAFSAFLRQRQTGDEDQTISATILNLPTSLRLQFLENSAGRQLIYTGGAVGSITVDANHLPLGGRADRLTGTITTIPGNISLNLGKEGGNVDLNANGAAIGKIEAKLTSENPSGAIDVPADMDGVRLTDTPSVYAIALRISSLRRVTAQQTPLNLFLDSTANRKFNARLQQQPTATAKNTYAEATLTNLQPSTRITLDDSGGRTQLGYTAGGIAPRLDIDTNAGDRQRLNGFVLNIPTSLTLCAVSASNLCGNTGRRANKLSMRMTASSAATVNLTDCQTVGCGERIVVSNLRLRKLEINAHTEPICVPFFGCGLDGAFGEVWFDTDGFELTGTVAVVGSTDLTARFPPGFNSNNRFVEWDGPFTDSSGSINCEGVPGDGQNLDLDIDIGVAIVDVAFILC